MEQLQYQLSVRETKENNRTRSHGQRGIVVTLFDQREGKDIRKLGIIISLVESQYILNRRKAISSPNIPPVYKYRVHPSGLITVSTSASMPWQSLNNAYGP